MKVVSRLRPLLEARMLPRDLSVDERVQIVAACIEDSDWPLAYAEHRPEELDMAHAVLRELARKVEPLGVEVAGSHMLERTWDALTPEQVKLFDAVGLHEDARQIDHGSCPSRCQEGRVLDHRRLRPHPMSGW
jgi:acyl carrier protein phosphodiesterase